MKFTDLPKNKQLLIFMLYHDVHNAEKPFTIADNGNDVINAYCITKNQKSLSSMLRSLYNRGYISVYENGWKLTSLGIDEAKYWLDRLSQCDVIDRFAKIANAYAKMACDIAPGNLQTDASDDAYASETENLESEIEDLKTENASMHDRNIAMQRRLAQALAELDAKNKRIAHLEDSLSKVNATFSQLQTWVTAMKNGAN